ncbi:hypothetical protein ACFSUS_00670 [Spirosoma soli]|uniref:Glycosyltransferase RgtA/B/C/D-like domain-containing protein n=1 Tax=Spirosoma soli TaxID=1770529 RepID=A0ABW5LWE7_9BACT
MGRTRKTTVLLSIALLIILTGSIITSMFFKEQWLWMDEVLSYILISDPSITHLNDAVVSGMDANPPFFANVYWFIGHYISANPQFLRAVSVLIFAITVVFFFRYTTTLLGTPVMNFVLITAIISLTYLNLTLSTQIRAYSLFLLISLGFFVISHRLMSTPTQGRLLVANVIVALLLVFTHNFGLFYVAASGAFFFLLFLWSKDRRYLAILGTYGLVLLGWFFIWYPNFVIQTDAGKPHSWIPMPTFRSFFNTVGELAPTISSTLERKTSLFFLPVLRFVLVVGLFSYVAITQVRRGFQAVREDKALLFYLFAGFVYLATITISLVVTLVHTSVFISRYLWPSHLLLIYQLVYAFYFFLGSQSVPRLRLARLLPVYMVLVAGFLFYQNKKIAIFPSGVMGYLPQLNKNYPVFFETADYFLPIWNQVKSVKACYLLDWETAATEGNILGATVEHKILKSVREKYNVENVVPTTKFNKANYPHFYVVDETSNYQIEHFVQSGRVKVINRLPIDIEGHRILECVF